MSSALADLKTLCRAQYAHPAALAQKMDLATGRGWRDWLPETVRAFVGMPVEEVQQLDKLMAVQVVLTNPDVADNWALLSAVVSAFNHRRSSFEWVDKPSILELAWAVHALNQIQRREFQPEALGFVRSVMMEDGCLLFPWSTPMVTTDIEPEATAKLTEMWAGGLADVKPSDVDDENLVHAQAAKLVACQEYIRANDEKCDR